ncbi:CPSF A subunit region-domain-containing protein [Lipomyces oligophaga]|uniref:CPSF A subunit region-domain-containing protein n=1 Tax=Lipomyces oligophaga TaxID=45792 RepID=UPI0034CD2C5F
MSYAVSVHKPTSVRYSVVTNLLAPNEYSLVLARPNALDIYSITATGLTLEKTVPIYGSITALLSINPTNSPTSLIFVLIEDTTCFTLSCKDGELVTNQVLDELDDRWSAELDTPFIAIIDPQSRGILVQVRRGKLSFIPLVKKSRKKTGRSDTSSTAEITGDLFSPVNLLVQETLIVSIIFLENCDVPTIAVLYRDSSFNKHVNIYEIEVDDGTIEANTQAKVTVEQGSSLLVAAKGHLGGYFVLGEQVILYVPGTTLISDDSIKPIRISFLDPVNICSCTSIDDGGERYLFGDDMGKIYMLQFQFQGSGQDLKIKSWTIESIGETSIPTTLSYLGSGFFFVTSHFSPSSLFYLSADEPHVRPIQTIPNLAPITDFDLSLRETTADVIACSGGFKSGSLRVVQFGVGVEIIGELGNMEGATALWTFEEGIIVVSFMAYTRIFQGDPTGDSIQELDDWLGFNRARATIGMGQYESFVVHVNESNISVASLASDALQSMVSISEISDCGNNSITGFQMAGEKIIIVAIKKIFCLSLDLNVLSSRELDSEISCLTATEEHVFVGLWAGCKVAIYTFDFTKLFETTELSGGIPRSVKVATLDTIPDPILYVGMVDGTLHSYTIDYSNAKLLKDHKSTSLGSHPVSLYSLRNAIFAVSSYPSMIYGQARRVAISAVNVPAPIAVARYVAPSMSDGTQEFDILILATNQDKILFGVLDQLMSTHVQTAEFQETVRRVKKLPKSPGGLTILTLNTKIDSISGFEEIECFVRLVDDSTFEILDTYALDSNEMAESINFGHVCGRAMVFVGTGYTSPVREDYVRGRIISFEVVERKLVYVHEHTLYGGAYAIEPLGPENDCKAIVVAINSMVRILSVSYTSSQKGLVGDVSFEVTERCGIRVPSLAIRLSVYKDYILIGDLMKSVILVRHTLTGDRHELKAVCRHFEPMWMTDVEIVDKEVMLGGEASGNLVVYTPSTSEVGDLNFQDDEPYGRAMQITSSMHFGDLINKIHRFPEWLYESSEANNIVRPRAYFATRGGAIYLYAEIQKSKINTLLNLQSNLSILSSTAGNLDFLLYRGFKSGRVTQIMPQRFVDGDFIELFLDLPDKQKEVAVGAAKKLPRGVVNLNLSVTEVSGMVEDLKRLH